MTEVDASEPTNGSWVAELEDAKDELSKIARRADANDDDGAGAATAAMALLKVQFRVCRAYSTLRQWERLSVAAKRGMALCQSLSESNSSENNGEDEDAPTRYAAAFRRYRKRARAELSVMSMLLPNAVELCGERRIGGPVDATIESRPALDGVQISDFQKGLYHKAISEGHPPDKIASSRSLFMNANMLQDAALSGDLRFLEFMVAIGAAVDFPFYKFRNPDPQSSRRLITIPREASALLICCATLAVSDIAYNSSLDRAKDTLDGIAACAMQLVRLGADVNLKLIASDPPYNANFLPTEMVGKTAFQIAAMSKRRALVALMLEHMQLSPEDRAEVVHCRCGSRLPWKMCHSTGVGQPPHFLCCPDLARTLYRVSPLARCPCGAAAKTYYKCCWMDNGAPKYLDDRTGFTCSPTFDWADPIRDRLKSSHIDDPAPAEFMAAQRQLDDATTEFTRRFHESPLLFERVCSETGPKTRMTTWDWRVYAGCLERLGHPPFIWTDVNWELDRAELLRRARDWNTALEKYCDDVGLQGEERELVVNKHTANPCGPCGFIGCDAFETKVRVFERCAQCKAIAYCSRSCQRKDWAEHSKVCKSGLLIGDAVRVRTGGLNSAEERRGLQESESSDGVSGGSGGTTNSTGH